MDAFLSTAKHFTIYGAGMAASKVATLILIPVYTRSLTIEEYGVLSILTITLMVLTPAVELGMGSAILRSYFDYTDAGGRRKVIGTAALILCISTPLFATAMALGAPTWSRLITGSVEYAVCFWLLGVMLITDSLFHLYTHQLRAEKRSMLFSAVNIIRLLVTCAMGIFLVVGLKKGLLGAVAANTISSVIMCIAIMPSLLSRANLRFDIPEARRLLAFGVPLVPMSLSAMVLASADRYFLLNMSGTIEAGKAVVGVYSLIYMYSNLFRIGVVEPLGMIWLPQMLSVRHDSRANEFYSRTFTFYTMISCFLVLCLTMAYPHAVLIVAGDRNYLGSPLVVWLVLLSLVCIGSTRLLGVGLTFARKTSYFAAFYACAGALNIALNFLLIPRYGMLGAGLATIGGASILPFLYYRAGAKFHRVEYEWPIVTRNAAVFFALSAGYFALPKLGLTGLNGIIASVSLALMYIPMTIAVGVLRRSEVRAVIDHIKSRGLGGVRDGEESVEAGVA